MNGENSFFEHAKKHVFIASFYTMKNARKCHCVFPVDVVLPHIQNTMKGFFAIASWTFRKQNVFALNLGLVLYKSSKAIKTYRKCKIHVGNKSTQGSAVLTEIHASFTSSFFSRKKSHLLIFVDNFLLLLFSTCHCIIFRMSWHTFALFSISCERKFHLITTKN